MVAFSKFNFMIKIWLKPFGIWTTFDHLNTQPVWYFDSHRIQTKVCYRQWLLPSFILLTFGLTWMDKPVFPLEILLLPLQNTKTKVERWHQIIGELSSILMLSDKRFNFSNFKIELVLSCSDSYNLEQSLLALKAAISSESCL